MATPSIEDWIKINALCTRYARALDHGAVDTIVGRQAGGAVHHTPTCGRRTYPPSPGSLHAWAIPLMSHVC